LEHNWDAIRIEYETTSATISELAEKYSIKLPTIKSRKQRQGWSKDASASPKDASKGKKMHPTKQMQPKAPEPDSDLTEKQRLFCMYYVKSFNATQSMIKAGYAADSAHVEGHRLLKNPKIAEYIRAVKQDMANNIYVEAMDVLNEYIKIAFANIKDYLEFGQKDEPVYDDEGNSIPDPESGEPMTYKRNFVLFKNSDEIDGTLISEVKQGKEGIGIKLHDKMRALDKLAEYFDLFPEKFKREIEQKKLELAQIKQEHDLKNAGGGDSDTGNIDQLTEMLKRSAETAGLGGA